MREIKDEQIIAAETVFFILALLTVVMILAVG